MSDAHKPHMKTLDDDVCKRTLREEIRAGKELQWSEQHADFLAAYNRLVEEEGVALQEWRVFSTC